MPHKVKHFYHEQSGTIAYVLIDEVSKKCAIIDSCVDFDSVRVNVAYKFADEIAAYVKAQQLEVEWILDTHVHADHITGIDHMKQIFPQAKTAIGEKVMKVIPFWEGVYNIKVEDHAGVYDHMFADGEEFKVGETKVRVIHTPGHTPACSSYVIEGAVFVGDTLFAPNFGCARCDFPGGSAEDLYDSIHKLYELPDDYITYLCHDYPEEGAEVQYKSTIGEQKAHNKLIPASKSKADFVQDRSERDSKLVLPKLIIQSLQLNIHAGKVPPPEDNGTAYLKMPVNKF
jgi:glyoxylase-like metal-dependent hydrolase (beta-lactamase superfamily II)